MIEKVYPREKYLSRIRPFYNSDIIKIITGIRRSGKSFILKAIIMELKKRGVQECDIVYLPLDKKPFKSISAPDQLEQKIDEMITSDHMIYLFIDEVQNVKGFEKVVQSYQEEGYSIFLTGSNSYLLSSEISTKLTGRYLTFETFTLDFEEYIAMKQFFHQPLNSDLYDELKSFITNGGFPKSLEFPTTEAKYFYTSEIIKEIFKKDITTRNKITNVYLFDRVRDYLINNYSSIFSSKNIVSELAKNDIKTKEVTIHRYIEILKKAKLIYECDRFDLKTKKSLKREQKYYLADLSLYFALNTDNRINYGSSLENLVFLFLLSNNYKVSIGRIGNFECDFIVRKPNNDYAYIQVTYTLQGESKEVSERIIEREYRPFRSIKDGYPRYIISLDRLTNQQEGVKHINAIDLFLHKVEL